MQLAIAMLLAARAAVAAPPPEIPVPTDAVRVQGSEGSVSLPFPTFEEVLLPDRPLVPDESPLVTMDPDPWDGPDHEERGLLGAGLCGILLLQAHVEAAEAAEALAALAACQQQVRPEDRAEACSDEQERADEESREADAAWLAATVACYGATLGPLF